MDFAETSNYPKCCAGCKSHFRCFEKGETLELRAANKKRLKGVTRDNVWDRLYTEGLFPKDASMLSRCLAYSLCPLTLMDDMTMELYYLYNQLGGTSRLAKVEEFYSQPAKYIMACRIIESERSKIMDNKKRAE